jgi:putative aldouronate transport system substrate-binding protein
MKKTFFKKDGKIMRKTTAILIATLLLASFLSGCVISDNSSNAPNSSEKKTSDENTTKDSGQNAAKDDVKPTLKVLGVYASVNLDEDFVSQLIAEKTGYKLEYHLLPQQDPDQKLMLEISSGEHYDFLRITSSQFALLNNSGALLDITDLLREYAPNVMKNVSEHGWKMTTTNGRIYGIPSEAGGLTKENRFYGYEVDGLGVRTDILSELDLELPTTIDELYDFLVKIKDSKGGYPVTGNSPYEPAILRGFGIDSKVEWYDVKGVYTPFVKMPALVDYLAYMQKLYADELLDNELPINKGENIQEKFINGKSWACINYSIVGIQSDISALKENNSDALINVILKIKKDENTLPMCYQQTSVTRIECVPKSSKYPADYVKYTNLRSDLDLFLSGYLGVEGESYYVENKDAVYPDYYPILPEFNKYGSGQVYNGFVPVAWRENLWFARVRKVKEMGDEFERANSSMNLKNQITLDDLSTFSYGLKESQEYRVPLNTLITNSLLKAIVEKTDPQLAISNLIKEWESMGGKEYEAAMQKWYADFK